MGYPVLLLDADDTLFDFAQASAAAFSTLCRTCSLPWSEEHQALYDSISQSLWAQLDRGQVTKEFLVVERFRRYLSRLGLPGDPAECNRIYLEALGRSAVLLPHALEVCRTLAQDHRLYIITNAVASVQRARLSQSAIAPYIQGAFISEEAGAAKPSRAYFDYVLTHLSGVRPEDCLVVGDSLSSDIQGANNADLPCCWFNRTGAPRPEGLRIDYEITSLPQLLEIA